MIVLDTSALLTRLHNEPGKDRVDSDLLSRHCAISSVNLAEFASKCLDGGMTRTDFDILLASLELTIIPLDTALLSPPEPCTRPPASSASPSATAPG